MYLSRLTYLCKHNFTSISIINNLLCDRYVALMCNYFVVSKGSAANLFHTTFSCGRVMRMPLTSALTFLSALQVSIPKKKLCGMGSWGVNHLEYYAPRTTAVMHGTGITSKLPLNKYTRVTANGAGGRALSSRLYKGIVVLPATLYTQPCTFSYARILQYITPYTYHSGKKILSHQLDLYVNKQGLSATKVQLSSLISLWTDVWVKLYKQSLLRYTLVRVTRKQPQINARNNSIGAYKKHQLPHAHKLWYNRMLPKKNKQINK